MNRIALIFSLLLIYLWPVCVLWADVEVLFREDFENLGAGDTPDLFRPTGSGNPDWDNALSNPEIATVALNGIDDSAVGGNTSMKYGLQTGTDGGPLLLGANFDTADERYFVIEYDIYLDSSPADLTAADLYLTDGRDELDGAGATTNASVHIQINDITAIADDNGGAAGIYRTSGQDSDVATDDGSEWYIGIGWTVGEWHRVRVIVDQEGRTFAVKVTNKATGITTFSAAGLAYNDPAGGFIRKVWFGVNAASPVMYLDNIIVYQTLTTTLVSGPTVTQYDYEIGPVNVNTGFNVNFNDDVDLQAIQYKIGSGGSWRLLTVDGVTAVDVSGAADTDVPGIATPLFIADSDFAGLDEGRSNVFFRADDSDGYRSENGNYLDVVKDTELPNVAVITHPTSPVIGALTAISGLVGDAVSGFSSNTATFTLRRTDDGTYWNGATWQSGAIQLATTHPASSDGTEAAWTNAGALPVLFGVPMEAAVSIDDAVGNGAYTGSTVTFMVQSGQPEITLNVSSLGPVRTNSGAGIDVDITDDIDLTAIEYSVDGGIGWADLTTDGVTIVDVSGVADTTEPSVPALLYMTNLDFASLTDGYSSILFRATDSDANVTTTTAAIVLYKDTGVPAAASITSPSTNPFGSLQSVAGQIADDAGGQGFAADSTTFALQRSTDSNYWDGSGWTAGPVPLATTHPSSTDGTTVEWVRNVALPAPTSMTSGATYTFYITATDRAGNSITNPYPLVFNDVPEVALVTSPADGTYGNFTVTPLSVQGYAADREGGSGLAANSTTFTVTRSSDGNYWNGAGWQAGAFDLATTHGATTANEQISWVPSGLLPPDTDFGDGEICTIQARVTNVNTGALTGESVSITNDTSSPSLSLVSTADANGDGYIDRLVASFDGPVDESTISEAQFSITPIAVTVSGVVGDWVASNEKIWVNFTDGVLATDILPTLSVNAGGIEDAAGNQNGNESLVSTDGAPPVFVTSQTVDSNGNGYLDYVRITFSEAIIDTSVNASNFDVAGVSFETFSSGTAGDTADNSEIYIGFEDWTLNSGVTPQFDYAAGTLTDLAGIAALTTDNIASTDAAGPALIGAFASDNVGIYIGIDGDDQVSLVFSEDTDQPSITVGNIDSVLTLNNGHSWLDGGGGFGSVMWSNARTLVVTLSTDTSDPTIWPGDTVTLDGTTVRDIAGNVSSSVTFSSVSGTFESDTTAPSLVSLSTGDVDGDGYTDLLTAVFSEPVNENTITDSLFSVGSGTISNVSDDTTPGDSTIWINLSDGELTSDAMPSLTIASGAIEDLPGNLNAASGPFTATDLAGPAIATAIAVPGEKSVYLAFSEPVTTGSSSVPVSVFSYSDTGNTLQTVTVLDLNANFFSGLLLSFDAALQLDDILSRETILVSAGTISDSLGNAASTVPRRISDVAIDAGEPVWAANGTTAASGTGTARRFDGTERLGFSDITIQIYNDTGEVVQLVYDVVSSPSLKPWLPVRLEGVDVDYNGNATTISPSETQGNLSTFSIPVAELADGATFEFALTAGDFIITRIINANNPRTLSLWSFSIADIKPQRGGVTILNNIFNASHGEETRIVYTVPERGNVTVLVSDMKGDLITVLARGMMDQGEYNAAWDGRNRNGKLVAPGLYFIKVVAPETNQIRKVLVIRNRR